MDAVHPQAAEIATESPLSITGIFTTLFCFAIYWVYKDLQKEWPEIFEHKENRKRRLEEISTVEPQAEEQDTHETQENVTFSDAVDEEMEDYSGVDDPLRMAPLNVDATLDNFFSRPIKIHEQEWGINSPFFFSIDPWTLFFSNKRVINRIANYKLMKADLHVKVMINGNGFHYGRAIVSYNPMRLDDDLTVNRTFIDADVVGASQRPHIWLNPTYSEGGEMKLPFFFYKNLLDVVAQDWQKMGELTAHSLQNLKHANGALDPVTVNVFAWAENVSFSVPTQVEPGAIAPQAMEIVPHADEYGQKPVSRIAGAVAKMAGHLSNVPVIGPFARATEIGASAAGAIATLFGYSSPVILEHTLVRPVAKTNFCNTNLPNDANKLTVDAKQELSVDPRTVGLDPTDQMTIKHVACTESFLTSYAWDVGTVPETLLWQCVVDPSVHRLVSGERHFPAPCFAVYPFKYWRGSMRFRFQVVCSNYHKGRLKVVYDPEGGIGDAEYNTAYTTIVDISDEQDFTVDVGWGQAFTWRQHRNTNGHLNQGSSSLGYTSSTVDYGNGTISVYVVNELAVPNTVTNNDISINVMVSMLDDFEVSVPTDGYYSRLRLSTSSNLVAPQAMEIVPHGGETTHITQMANKTTLDDPSSLFHFGEAVGSFRTILKRYCLSEFMVPQGGAGRKLMRYTRPHFPMTPGYIPENTSVGAPNFNTQFGIFNYTCMTPMRYISCAYAGMRGGVRYAADLSAYTGKSTSLMYRLGSFNNPRSFTASTTSTGAPSAILGNNPTYFNGATIQNSEVNPLISAEYPHYTPYRFKPAKYRDQDVLGADPFQDSWNLDCYVYGPSDGTTNDYIPLYTSAGEDFTCFWYLGPPIFYDSPAWPPSE